MSNKRKPTVGLTAWHITTTPEKVWECPDCNSEAGPPQTPGAAYTIQHDDTCPFWMDMQRKSRSTSTG